MHDQFSVAINFALSIFVESQTALTKYDIRKTSPAPRLVYIRPSATAYSICEYCSCQVLHYTGRSHLLQHVFYFVRTLSQTNILRNFMTISLCLPHSCRIYVHQTKHNNSFHDRKSHIVERKVDNISIYTLFGIRSWF